MKRVLIVTYYWPPAGGISVQRSLKIAKYLRSFGWEPVVYAPKDAQYPYFDDGNFKDIPEGLEVLKRPILEPFNLFKKLTGRKKDESLNNILHVRERKKNVVDKLALWIRGNFFIPDARALWIRPSVGYLRKYLQEYPVDAIFTDGPPHTNTAIACKLKKHTGIPWLADFQDPWTQVDYYQLFPITKWAHRRHSRMEQEVFRRADKITIVSPTWKKDLESIGARNVEVIYWGYDEDDFRDLKARPNPNFSISHAGLLGHDRNTPGLFQSLQELKQEVPQFGQKLRLELAGQVDYEVLQAIKDHGLEENLIDHQTIKRGQALQLMADSSLLLLPLNQAANAAGRIPGKFFEYLRVGRPILCFGPENSDVKRILEQTRRGKSFTYNNKEGLKQFLKAKFENFLDPQENPQLGDISQYSSYRQTEKIAKFLDEISS